MTKKHSLSGSCLLSFFLFLLLLLPLHGLIGQEAPSSDASSHHSVRVSANLAGVYLSVDGVDQGLVPLELQLEPGEYEFSLGARRLHTLTETVVVDGNKDLNFELRRKVGTVAFFSDPTGAQLFIDDIDFGTTPRSVRLYYGPHIVRYRTDEYDWHTMNFEVWEDGELDLPFTIMALPALLSIGADPIFPDGEPVLVNGAFIGTTPILHYPVYGTTLDIQIQEQRESFSILPGYSITIQPNSQIPLFSSDLRIALEGYRYTPSKPDLLPEREYLNMDTRITRFDGRVMGHGTMLSALASGLVGLAQWQRTSEPVLSAATGGAFFVVGQLAVIMASRVTEVWKRGQSMPLVKNQRTNQQSMNRYESQLRSAEQINSRLLGSMNIDRGQWIVTIENPNENPSENPVQNPGQN